MTELLKRIIMPAVAMRSVLQSAIPLCLLMVASWGRAAQQINVATPAKGLAELPVVVAMRNGYFRTEGLEIQKIQIQPSVAVRALLTGEVDFNLGWEASLRAAMSGMPVKMIAGLASRPLHVLISRPEIRAGTDLKGKALGVDSSLSTTGFLSRVAARYLGVEPEKDVGIVESGSTMLRLEALRTGDIHATVVDVAVAIKAEEDGFKQLLHVGNIIDLPTFGVAVTTTKLATYREGIKRFLRATLRGARFITRNRIDTIRIIQSYLKTTSSLAAKSYDSAVRSFTEDGLISDRALALSVRRARDEVPFTSDSLLSQVADWSVLREIMAERRKIPFWLKQSDS
jgi:ABC-type nitrate/sulfonate/bicarbonate transport system substrate-binding protein